MSKTVIVEGPILFDGKDPDGDVFRLDYVEYGEFAKRGYVTSACKPNPGTSDIIGWPEKVEQEGDHIKLIAVIREPVTVKMLGAFMPQGGGPYRKPVQANLGFAIAGIIKRRDGGVIEECTITSVALVPESQLTDKRCVCTVRKPSDGS